MRTFTTLSAAINFVNGLNIPESEIEKIEKLPHVFQPYDVKLKWADCDIISIRANWVGTNKKRPDDPPYRQVFEVQKRYYSSPLSLSESLGMTPERYKTPLF